jgi:hypothetical protein
MCAAAVRDVLAFVAACDDPAECARLAAAAHERLAVLLGGPAGCRGTGAARGVTCSTLDPAAVVSVSRALEAPPWRRSVASAWLRRSGLVRRGPEGREVVVWADVLDALRDSSSDGRPPRREAPPLPRRRARPNPLAGIVPIDL